MEQGLTRHLHAKLIAGQPGVETGSACWVENPWRLYTFMLPCYLILLVDVGCFVMIARVVIKSSKAGSSSTNLNVSSGLIELLLAW